MAHVPAAERRPQLVRAAIELMSREGIAAGSTRAIATELGVAQATVHYTFGTKEGLYRAVLEQVTQDLIERVRQAVPEGASFEDTLGALGAAQWRTVREHPEHYQLLTELLLFAKRSPALDDVPAGHFREIVAVTTELIAEAAERTGRRLAQSAETLARFYLAGMEGLAGQHLALPDEQGEYTFLRNLIGALLALADGALTPVAQPE